MTASATSQADRALSTAERVASTEARALVMFERAEHASQRDQQAAARDLQAAARDRYADRRDRAAEDWEGATGRDAKVAKARAISATDRVRAARDRARAAHDRDQAAADRGHARAELERAELDDLTGFYRLGLGRAVLQREIDRSRRSYGRMVLGYCDVDELKQRNDELGHAAGDALLKAAATAIRSRVRSYDPVVRVGGDEFICAMPDVDIAQADRIFTDIQTKLAAADNYGSMSFGMAELRADDSLDTLMERSDRNLRQAKAKAKAR